MLTNAKRKWNHSSVDAINSKVRLIFLTESGLLLTHLQVDYLWSLCDSSLGTTLIPLEFLVCQLCPNEVKKHPP